MGPHHTQAATLLALLLYLAMLMNAGWARTKYKVKAPAVAGNEQFERAYRIQMNTLEQLVFFLPSMWLWCVVPARSSAHGLSCSRLSSPLSGRNSTYRAVQICESSSPKLAPLGADGLYLIQGQLLELSLVLNVDTGRIGPLHHHYVRV